MSVNADTFFPSEEITLMPFNEFGNKVSLFFFLGCRCYCSRQCSYSLSALAPNSLEMLALALEMWKTNHPGRPHLGS